jgi:hypothetical protein
MEMTSTVATNVPPAEDETDNCLFALLRQGFTPRQAVDFAALEMKDALLARLRKMGLYEPSEGEIAAIAWKTDRILRSRGAGMEVDVELRRYADGKLCVLLGVAMVHYCYALTPDGLRAPAEEEMDALLARTVPVDEGTTEFLDAIVEVRLDARGLPVAFVEKGYTYNLPDDRALDVVFSAEGWQPVDRSVLVERYNCSTSFPGASLR